MKNNVLSYDDICRKVRVYQVDLKSKKEQKSGIPWLLRDWVILVVVTRKACAQSVGRKY